METIDLSNTHYKAHEKSVGRWVTIILLVISSRGVW